MYLQLEEHCARLKDEVDREREERNYFQLERDKVNTFWDITKRQLDESKATIRNKERELEDAEERHQVEIKVRIFSDTGLNPSHFSFLFFLFLSPPVVHSSGV